MGTVNYKWLARDQAITYDAAKQCLHTFATTHPDDVHATYYLSGESHQGRPLVAIVAAHHVDRVSTSLARTFTTHVYSLHPKAAGVADASTALTAELEQTDHLLRQLLQEGSTGATVSVRGGDSSSSPSSHPLVGANLGGVFFPAREGGGSKGSEDEVNIHTQIHTQIYIHT